MLFPLFYLGSKYFDDPNKGERLWKETRFFFTNIKNIMRL